MKLWIIEWGFNTSMEGGEILDSIWTDETKAREYLQNVAQDKDLRKHKNKKTGEEFPNHYTDGDYYMTLTEVYSDTPWMYGEPE